MWIDGPGWLARTASATPFENDCWYYDIKTDCVTVYNPELRYRNLFLGGDRRPSYDHLWRSLNANQL